MEIVTKNVMIRLTAVHTGVDEEIDETGEVEVATDENGDEEPVSMVYDMDTEGILRVSDDKIEIEYFENELTGIDGTCANISFDKRDRGLVTLLRTGTVQTAMTFEEGKRNVCVYTTDELTFEITVRTWDLVNEIDENGGKIVIDYAIEVRGSTVEHTKIEIYVTVGK